MIEIENDKDELDSDNDSNDTGISFTNLPKNLKEFNDVGNNNGSDNDLMPSLISRVSNSSQEDKSSVSSIEWDDDDKQENEPTEKNFYQKICNKPARRVEHSTRQTQAEIRAVAEARINNNKDDA